MQADALFQESTALVAGAPLHFIEAGHGDLVLLIHGSLCDYRYWRWQMAELSRHFRVVAPSLPGCWPEAVGGALPANSAGTDIRQAALADTRYGIASHVQAMVEFCEQAAPQSRVHLVGHSRGAQVALEAALEMPEKVAGLVLADPGFPFSGEPEQEPVHVPIAGKLGQAPLDEVIGEFVDAVNGAGTWRKTVGWFKEMVRANAWTLLPQLADIHRGIDLSSLAASLRSPVLLIGGEFSPPRYGSRISGLLQALPDARQVVVPRAAHGMNLANAPYFNETVRRFLLEEAA